MKTIGRIDILDFPGLGLFDLPVKIDTGAYTSCIHCSGIHEKEEDGKAILTFFLLDQEDENFTGVELVSDQFERTQVKSSSGHLEDRYVIETEVEIFGERMTIELSLTDRTEMRFPVLLGRKVLKSNFLVDVSKSNLSFKKKMISTP